ncbi:MAG: SDR family NAD(P)-dependent oxidoreductase [Candidatus Nanopelagicales bacterium]
MELEGAVALVTGGASGLGAATAAALVGRGAQVVSVDLPTSVAAAEPQEGVYLVACDVTDEAQVQRAVSRAVSLGPLRAVVCCAGIAPTSRVLGRSGIHDLDLFATVVRVNLCGTFNTVALAAGAMAVNEPDAQGQRGLVVTTASVAAFDGQVGQAAYSASKGGVAAMTLPLARDLASWGIRVMTIAPGIVDTPMLATVDPTFREGLAAGVPFPRRLARPDEFAQLVLATVDHDYLNGETIRMDGALRMAPR